MEKMMYYASNGQVKCFCDRESCDDSLLCQGDFCLIGLRREDGSNIPKLRQHCGSAGDVPYLSDGPTRCEERVDSWQELCKCNENFCNTFAYLRSSIDSRQDQQDVIQFTKQDVSHPPVRDRPPINTLVQSSQKRSCELQYYRSIVYKMFIYSNTKAKQLGFHDGDHPAKAIGCEKQHKNFLTIDDGYSNLAGKVFLDHSKNDC
ncbi:hypothetical protein DICVIV_12743 [Dictyocaulus viviparus]|uniref:Uncharacterized protein n=1 Tax=Dictyocaulus viviparus TaxID=29172 RepID=A0A0D8X9M1_DICVI|nr:hypothetical protein DICVIV_12743 [Dictyocaulus viviparus]